MLYFNKADVSEGIMPIKEVHQKGAIFVTFGMF